ncbi:MAG: efflux RND transporter periplasmic adaptor subunit [Chitinophagaceae bacterium]
MKKYFILFISIATLSAITSCGGKADSEITEEETHEEAGGGHANENMATLTSEQIKTIGIELGTIEQKELTNSIKANGILTVPNQNKAFVTPLLSGVIKTLLVQPGTFVKQGQAIATIVNPDLIQMQQQLQQVNAQIALAEIEFKRQKELVEGNAAPLKRLQQVQTELATLKTQRSGLQKQLSALGASQGFSSSVTVRAPISGTVSKVMVQLGSNVDISIPIAEIVNNSLLHLDLYVYEKDLAKLKAKQVIHFTVTNNAGKEYDAEIFSIGTAFESNTKTIPVHAKVMGDKTGLIDGMNVTANISLDKATVSAVPTESIVSYQGQDYIFVQSEKYAANADSVKPTEKDQIKESGITFEKIPVAKGTTDVGYSEITLLKQIPVNAKIVVKGAFFILAKMTNTEDE